LVEGGWEYALYPASPNPSGSGTVGISFSLPEQSVVSLVVYDVQGRKVKTLVSGSENPGFRSVSWNGRDEFGKPVSGGVYFYRLEAGAFTQTRKLVLVR
jgi:flagellar hook assembly protein FlgD